MVDALKVVRAKILKAAASFEQMVAHDNQAVSPAMSARFLPLLLASR